MRRILLIAAGVALAASSVGVGASAYAGGSPDQVTANINGAQIMKVNRFFNETYHFPDVIKVHQGERILFVNNTVEAHTVTLVRESDLPTTAAAVFNCNLCNSVNTLYGANGNGPPAGVQIDNGKLTDDESDHDADLKDPVVPPGIPLPFPVLLEDFNAVSHSNGAGAPTIGDSTLVPSTSNGVPFSARTVKVTAEPGEYHLFCTFHPWMQSTLIVTG